VVIPCHSTRRWPQLVRAVESVHAQTPRPAQVVVAVDHNEELLVRARRELAGVTVIPNALVPGASGNRNTGITHTDTPLVALLDDDAQARPGWLAHLTEPFVDDDVIGSGGAVVPAWERPRPRWFPDELLWAIAATSDTRSVPGTVRNVWSASMALCRAAFDAAGGFHIGFGTRDHRTGMEDTELCLRMSRVAGGRWVYVPDAVVDHAVPVERTTVRYLVARCYREGQGKIKMARVVGGTALLDVERNYLRATMSRAVAGGFGRALRGRGLVHATRAAVLFAGVAAALAGGAAGALARRVPQPHPYDRSDLPTGSAPPRRALAVSPGSVHPSADEGGIVAGGRELRR
jgi:hypothetical protein